MRYDDRADANRLVGCSRIAQPRSDCAKQRHERRLADNLASGAGEMRAWCAARGWTLQIKNRGQHWLIRDGSRIVAQWWPSSAKLVFGSDFGNGIHTHGWDQVIRLLEEKHGKAVQR